MIEIKPIGFVIRDSSSENERDRSLVARIVINEALAPALDGGNGFQGSRVVGENLRTARLS
jgi:hypothetical protein